MVGTHTPLHIRKALKTLQKHSISQTFLSTDFIGIFRNIAVEECSLTHGNHIGFCVNKMKKRVQTFSYKVNKV